MKTNRILAVALLGLSTLTPQFPTAFAQGTAFIYQGRLDSGGAPYTGSAEFQPTLWNAASGGNQIAVNAPAQVVAVVTNGLFVLALDFGASFPGADRWLQLEVRTTVAPFTILSPRQPLTPAPYAITASNLTGPLSAAQLSGAISSANLAGTYSGPVTLDNAGNNFTGSGAGLTGLNASQLSTGTVPDARLAANLARTNQVWLLGGNAGTTPGTHFLGTTDNQPLNVRVNNQRVLRFEDNGDGSDADGIADGAPNLIGGSPANFVAAGVVGATIAGGGATNYSGAARTNLVLADYGTVGGGWGNRVRAGAVGSTIAGGGLNSINASEHAAIGGGRDNAIVGVGATIAGGLGNTVSGEHATIGGGQSNGALATGATVGGGNANFANGTNSAISGGSGNNVAILSFASTIAGGQSNDIGSNSPGSVVSGGYYNNIAYYSFAATIGGGNRNNILAAAEGSTIGGGTFNSIAAFAQQATIGGGDDNAIDTLADFSVIGGGGENQIESEALYGTIAGGRDNAVGAEAEFSSIGGGESNTIEDRAQWATIAGGDRNTIGSNSDGSTIGGGSGNSIRPNSSYATIPGGVANSATNLAFAAGHFAKAIHQGSFVWADSQIGEYASTAPDQVSFRCLNGVRFGSGSGGIQQQVRWTPGTGTWAFSSDRNLKENFQPVDGRAVLEKVCDLPITEWNYQGYEQRHIGPMAQDFHARFPLNEDETMLNSADLHGVALAAIQGLNQKLTEELKRRDAEITELKRRNAENADLKARLADLEQLVTKLISKGN